MQLPFSWGDKSKVLPVLVIFLVLVVSSWLVVNWHRSLREGQLADYIQRAQAAEEEGKYQQAFGLYTQALAIDPVNSTALTGLGDVAFAVGNYETSVAYYRQAGQSERPEGHYFLSLKAMAELDLDAAIKELTVAQEGVSPQGVLSPAQVNSLKGQLQQAVQEKNAALQKAQIGRLLIEQKAPTLAVQVLKPLVQEEPDYRDAHYLLGAAYYQGGEREDARRELQTALSLDANYEPAQSLLRQLEAEEGS